MSILQIELSIIIESNKTKHLFLASDNKKSGILIKLKAMYNAKLRPYADFFIEKYTTCKLGRGFTLTKG